MQMINCIPRPVKRGAIQFGIHNTKEIRSIIGKDNMDDDRGQTLVNTKRHGWQNVNCGDYLVFDENNRLLKVLRADDFERNYIIND